MFLDSDSAADPDPGSGAFLTPGPGSGIRHKFIPDYKSRIPNPYFLEPSDKYLVKKSCNSFENWAKLFSSAFQQ